MRNIPYAMQSINNDDINAVKRVLRSEFLTQGPIVLKFEKAISDYCGAKYAVAVNSGTSALHLACIVAGLKRGDEAITSPITFVASANCILYCEAKPVFADVLEDTLCIDPEQVKKKITYRTKAIIPVDFAGQPAELERIKKIVCKRKIVIIEDAAHALGSEYKGEKIGSGKYSDMTILSFHAVKHITTGEGGVVLTNKKEFYRKLIMLRTHGISRESGLMTKKEGRWYYEMHYLGFNYRLTDFQCALGISQLKKITLFIKRKREIVATYNKAFASYDEVTYLTERKHVSSSWHLYILKFNLNKIRATRKELFNEYRKHGIMINVHYIPVYLQPYYRRLGYKSGLCPKAEQYYQQAITLPLFPGMYDSDVKKVIKVTQQIIEKHRIK